MPCSCPPVVVSVEPMAGLPVEQMDQGAIGTYRQNLAGFCRDAVAEGGDQRLAADAKQHLRLRSRGLHHLHACLDDVGIEPQMLGPDAVDGGAVMAPAAVG